MIFEDRSDTGYSETLENDIASAADVFQEETTNFVHLVRGLAAKPAGVESYVDKLQESTAATTDAFGAFVKVQVDGAGGDPELFTQPITELWVKDDEERQVTFSNLFGGTFDNTAYSAIVETVNELVDNSTDSQALIQDLTAAYGSSLDADAIAFAECLQEQYEQAGRKGFKLEITPRHVSKALLGLAGVTVVLGAHSILRRRHSK